MLLYLLNSYSHRMAPVPANVDPAYVFPSRVEEIAVLQETLKTNPTDGRAAYYLGNALASKLRFKEALDAWRIAAQFDSKNAVFGVGRPALQSQAREYVAAALEFEAAGRRDEAEKWLRRAAEDALNSPTQPEEPWSEHYYYKAVALDRLSRKDEARALYERLARLNDEQQTQSAEPTPPRGALRFLLAGWGLKALGRNEEARAAFQRALQLDPANDRAQAELDRLSR